MLLSSREIILSHVRGIENDSVIISILTFVTEISRGVNLLNDNFRAELYDERMSSFRKIIDRPVAALSDDLANQRHKDRVPFFFFEKASFTNSSDH